MKKKRLFCGAAICLFVIALLGGCSPAAQPPADPPSGTAADDVWQVSEYEATLTLQPPQGTEADVTAYTYADGAFYIAVTYLEPMAQFGQKLEIHRYDLTAKTDEVIYERQAGGMWGNELCTNGEKVAFAEYCEGEHAVKVYDIAGKNWSTAAQGLDFGPVLTIGQTHLFWERTLPVPPTGLAINPDRLCAYRLSDGEYTERDVSPSMHNRVAVYRDEVVYQSANDVLTVLNMTDGSTKEYRLGEQTAVFDLDYDGESILWSSGKQPRQYGVISCSDQSGIRLERTAEHKGRNFSKAYLVDGPWVSLNIHKQIYLWSTEQNTFTLLYETDNTIAWAQRVGDRVFFLQSGAQDGKIHFLCLEKK